MTKNGTENVDYFNKRKSLFDSDEDRNYVLKRYDRVNPNHNLSQKQMPLDEVKYGCNSMI